MIIDVMLTMLTGIDLGVCTPVRSAECRRPFGGRLGAHQRAIRALMDAISSREVAAGV